MKVLVTGASGQVGWAACRQLAAQGTKHLGVSSADFDIGDAVGVSRAISAYAPDAVLHCAAYTNVDAAEEDRARCHAVNAEGTEHIAAACQEVGAKLLYVSTDYVFSGQGDSPYQVGDPVGPINWYGETKRQGENAVRRTLERYFIVRTSWVFGENGRNFIRTIARVAKEKGELRVVDDQIGSPTYAKDLAAMLVQMIQTEQYGTYHATNEGFCSWYQLACAALPVLGIAATVHPVHTDAYPTKAKRPMNSRLDKAKLSEKGFARLPAWQDAVRVFCAEEWV